MFHRRGRGPPYESNIFVIWSCIRLLSVNRDVRGNSQTKANFPFICDSFRQRAANIPKLFSSCLLAQPSWRAMRIKYLYACSQQKYGIVYWIDIVHSILYIIMILSSIKYRQRCNSYSLIWHYENTPSQIY